MQQQLENSIDQIIDQIQTGQIQFPLIKQQIADPQILFNNLKKYIPTISYQSFRYKNIQWKDPHYEKIKYKEKQYVSFVTQHADYEQIDRLVDYYNEIPRLTAKRIDKNYSVLDAWSNTELLRRWLHTQFQKHPDFEFSAYEWREELWKRSLECNAFKASLAKSVFHSFKAKRVLDFSAGWGDRLLGALAQQGIDMYLGFDPNPSLEKGYNEIIQHFAPHDKHNSYQIRIEPFETAEIDMSETFDLVFTSPPYFNFEIYTKEDETQSIQKYPTHSEWIVQFLFRSLYKSWCHLQLNGNMIIHLSDVYKTHYIESMTLFVLGWCNGSRFDGSIASIGDSSKPRPMWIYNKCINNKTIINYSSRKNMQQHYPEIYERIMSSTWL